MKALLIITGRGMGGDAVTALNIARAVSKKGVECEFALDHTAPGLLLKKEGIGWHKISIPQAGGHAATKTKLVRAGFKTTKASLEAVKLIKKVKPDVVVGIIGGGAIIGCLSAKMARVPAVGILITPTDAKVCTRLNANKYLNESNIIYLGYVDWIQDLYNLADVSVLSDDGVMIHEAIACKVPIVALTGVKYGRYHNMAAVFPGAVAESSIDELEQNIKAALDNIDEMKNEAQRYGEDVLDSGNKIADIIITESKK